MLIENYLLLLNSIKMQRLILLCLLLLLLKSCGTVNSQERGALNIEHYEINDSLKEFVSFDQKQIALVNAYVVDGTGQAGKANQSVLLDNGKIVSIGADIIIPDTYEVINVEGKTIIPGIVGVHNHLHIPHFPFIGEVASKMYLASGVTTIQTCGSASSDKELELASSIQAMEQLGPYIVASGPYFTGEGGSQAMIIPRNEKHIRDTMQHWIQKGISWFKVYRHTKPDDLEIIVDEAHKHNCKVTGHFCSITFAEAIKIGIDGIEHGLNSASDFRKNKDYGVCNGSREYMDELIINSKKVKDLQQLIIDSNVFVNSTLAIYETSVPNRAFADKRTLRAMSPFLKNQYDERRANFDQRENDLKREKRLKKIMEFEYQFYQLGGLLGCGADAGRHNLPGFGDQRNFELLREAGFTVEEAIQIMTHNGAQILELPNIGSIEIGKNADLVVLDGLLNTNPAIIRNVETVFKNGIGYKPSKILETTNGKIGVNL